MNPERDWFQTLNSFMIWVSLGFVSTILVMCIIAACDR